ncbi:hypothetical protein GYMLUDRAFT_248756 [Collybiopsis luxurians FD-317 M1]|uniref:Unplaced genomic scaffold GYMLUscaffold_59, whole genome shotgun sequence n=1 Tax=Collybiopsis luxurians FD-317 M1 TaxID=944289 RepID=A0A0D0CBC0_9AGAR|nr:hypothetical protein GYMLUDRAFT_248756 [Collybiopsis luxurians FD-317 M1]
MGNFLRKQFALPILGSFSDLSSSTSPSSASGRSCPPTSTLETPLGDLASLDVTSCETVSLAPPKKKQKKAAGGPPEERNHFLELSLLGFPPSLTLWNAATEQLSSFHCQTGQSQLEYAVPHPSDLTRYKNKDWQALLEAAAGLKNADEGYWRGTMLAELCSVVKASQMSLDESKLSAIQPQWAGQVVALDCNGTLDSRLVSEVLWELYEINFHFDLLSLDCRLIPEPQGDDDWAVTLCDQWFD